MVLRKFFPILCQTIGELICRARSPAKVANTLPRLAHDFIRAVEYVFHHVSKWILDRHVLGHALHPKRDSMESLKKRVVQVARDAGSLGQSFLKANREDLRELVHSHSIDCENYKPGTDQQYCSEPPGLHQRRLHSKPNASPRTIPDAVAVACHHTKLVAPRVQIAVGSFPVCGAFAPFLIKAVQPVAVANPLGVFQTQPNESKRDSFPCRGNAQSTSHIQWTAVR